MSRDYWLRQLRVSRATLAANRAGASARWRAGCCPLQGDRRDYLTWGPRRRAWGEVIYLSDGEECRAMSGFGQILRDLTKDRHYVRSHRHYIKCDKGTPTSDSLFLGL